MAKYKDRLSKREQNLLLKCQSEKKEIPELLAKRIKYINSLKDDSNSSK